MQCSCCKSENDAEAKFCDQCGERLDYRCPRCGETNRSNARFCRNCGGPLGALGDRQAAPASPSETAESTAPIPTPRSAVEAERKQVTILFADIRGSTRLIEKLDPEEVRKHFDPVLRVMMDAVHRYGGTVNQVLGDGVMALFGAPLALQDHAVRACYAALAMQDEMRRAAARQNEIDHGAIRIGIGINSGEVVVRSLTNDLNVDYSALGHTTHLAARMEEHAPAGKILISAETLREVEGFFEVTPLGALKVKGFSTPIDAFELTGATTARNRLQAAAARGLSRFVGRQREIEFMQRVMEQSTAGHGQVLAVVGEAGMGKSRLLRHFLAGGVAPGWRVLEAPSVSYGKANLYFPVVELLRDYLSLKDSADSSPVQSAVAEQVLRLSPSLCDTIPPLLALLDALPLGPSSGETMPVAALPEVADAIANYLSLEPQERRQQTFDALTELFLAESQKQPLLLIFEDLHWIDGETEEFLNVLVQSLPRGRIFLLVNYRPGFSHSWANRDYYQRLRLTPLPATGVGELLDSLLGRDDDLASLKDLLIQRTDGNPFFVEESVRSLAEAGVLVGARGRYRAAVRVESVRIPNKVQTVLAERIDRLPRAEKQLLQTAAVIGVTVPARLLRAVAGLPEEELHGILESLQAAEFLHESSLFPELEYRFNHALSNEVAYGALLKERRCELHGQIFHALENAAGEKPQEDVETLAHHAFRGELWGKAAVYLKQAGSKAMTHSAFGEALASYVRAFEALAHLPETQARAEQQIDLHLDCRNVLFLRGDLARVGEQLAQAEALADRIGDGRRLARVLNFQNSYYGLIGDPERAIEAGQRALALPATLQDRALRAVTSYYTGVAYNKVAQYDRAAVILRAGMQSVEGELKYQQFGTAAILSAIFRSHLSQSLAMTGDFDEGLARGAEGVQIADEANHPVSQIHVNSSLGLLYLFKGDYHEAIPVLERALALCEEKHITIYVPLVAPRLGYAYLHAGRPVEGLCLLEQSIEDSAAVGRAGFLALNLTWLGEAYLIVERIDEAMVLADRALELSRQHKEPGHGALALKLRGDIALGLTPKQIEQAEAHYSEAFRLAGDLAMRPLQAHCHAALAQVHAAAGNRDRARQELTAARELFRAMAMSFFLAKAEAESARFG
jgi:class 3 adenylate cyclase/tetratricopeptide (TPR) repeat protein